MQIGTLYQELLHLTMNLALVCGQGLELCSVARPGVHCWRQEGQI